MILFCVGISIWRALLTIWLQIDICKLVLHISSVISAKVQFYMQINDQTSLGIIILYFLFFMQCKYSLTHPPLLPSGIKYKTLKTWEQKLSLLLCYSWGNKTNVSPGALFKAKHSSYFQIQNSSKLCYSHLNFECWIVSNFASYQAVKIVCGRKRVNLNWKGFTGLEIQDKLFQFLSPVTTLGNSLISSVI